MNFKSFIALLLCCGLATMGTAQCPTTDIILDSQADIDNFSTDYPGCTMIPTDVNVTINDAVSNNITNVDGLSQVVTVGGFLRIQSNDALTNVDGLSQITSIGEDLAILQNDVLTNVDGCSQITSIGEDLLIQSNSALTNVDGLSQITSTVGDISVTGNPALTNVDGFSQITSVGGKLNITSHPSLTNLDGLSQVTSVGGSLWIGYTSALMNVDGLSQITSVGDFLQISNNIALTNLDGLNQITSVGDRLTIRDNANLTNVDGLSQITSVGGDLWITDNDVLTNVNGLSQITSVGERLWIMDNPQLSECCALCGLLVADAADPSVIGSGIFIKDNLTGCNNQPEILDCDCALPIELTTFQAKIENSTTLLTWQTATETNNKGFEIQRSKDATTWEKIAWQAGQGNSQILHDYRYIDKNPLFGTSYYRLKQIDFDDTFSYSDIVKVHYVRAGISIYPNPAKNILHFQYGSPGNELVDFIIENHLGQQVIQSQAYTNQPVQLDISSYPAGLYLLSVLREGESISQLFSVGR